MFAVAPGDVDTGMRSKAKMINFGIVYGLSDFGLADRLNIPREEAKEFIDSYLARFPRVEAFIAQTRSRTRARRATCARFEAGAARSWSLRGAQLPGALARRAISR